jgi:hypothetical protein
VARTRTFEAAIRAAFTLGYVSKASEGSTAAANTVNVSQESSPGSRPLVPVYGHFRDDPTWERFMQNIEEYSEQVDAFERTLE